MKSKRLENTQNCFNKIGEEASNAIKLRSEFMLGDVLWVRIRGNLWWPAQVVDENMVGKNNKPKKKLLGDLLVRLYGTYTYLYRDPMKYRSEFEKILEHNNGSYSETLEKTLEQGLSHLKSSTLKRSVSELGEKVGVASPKDKRLKHDTHKKNEHKSGCPGSVTHSPKKSSELSVRRIRVMQSLGLVAPLGSPFHKNGVSVVRSLI